ncbi:hypothetical protein VAA96_004530 [Salmonella enterica]|nr:hypothetical protein [Salmonella enterica]
MEVFKIKNIHTKLDIENTIKTLEDIAKQNDYSLNTVIHLTITGAKQLNYDLESELIEKDEYIKELENDSITLHEMIDSYKEIINLYLKERSLHFDEIASLETKNETLNNLVFGEGKNTDWAYAEFNRLNGANHEQE